MSVREIKFHSGTWSCSLLALSRFFLGDLHTGMQLSMRKTQVILSDRKENVPFGFLVQCVRKKKGKCPLWGKRLILHVESPCRREICMAQSPGKLQLQFCLTRCRITQLWGMKLAFFVVVYHCTGRIFLFKNESKKWNRRTMKANVTWIRSASLFRKKACLEIGPSRDHLFSLLGYLRKWRKQNLDRIKSKLTGAK